MDNFTTEHFGIIAVALMVLFYACEERHPVFVLLFAIACAMAATYAALIGSYPFLIAEGVWSVVAMFRWWRLRSAKTQLA